MCSCRQKISCTHNICYVMILYALNNKWNNHIKIYTKITSWLICIYILQRTIHFTGVRPSDKIKYVSCEALLFSVYTKSVTRNSCLTCWCRPTQKLWQTDRHCLRDWCWKCHPYVTRMFQLVHKGNTTKNSFRWLSENLGVLFRVSLYA